MRDDIVLTIPSRGYREVASLVLGGVGTRLDLSYERMDDLQLAILSLVDAAAADEVTVRVAAEDHGLAVAVGPLRADAESDEALARVVGRLTDAYSTESRDGECWATVSVGRSRQGAPGSTT